MRSAERRSSGAPEAALRRSAGMPSCAATAADAAGSGDASAALSLRAIARIAAAVGARRGSSRRRAPCGPRGERPSSARLRLVGPDVGEPAVVLRDARVAHERLGLPSLRGQRVGAREVPGVAATRRARRRGARAPALHGLGLHPRDRLGREIRRRPVVASREELDAAGRLRRREAGRRGRASRSS